MNYRIWLVKFFSFTFVVILLIGVFNYFTDYDILYENPHSFYFKRIQRGVDALNAGNPIIDSSYHIRQGALQRRLHLENKNPPIFALGTSRLLLLNSSHLQTNNHFINLSIHGGGINGIIEMWQYFLNRNNPSLPIQQYAIIEFSPHSREENIFVDETLFRALSKKYLDREIQQRSLERRRSFQTMRRAELFSFSYLLQNLQFINRDNFFAIPNEILVGKITIQPDGSYTLPNHSPQDEKHFIDFGEMLTKDNQQWEAYRTLIKVLTLDMQSYGITPILLLTPYPPLTYDTAIERSDFLHIVEADILAFAKEHGIPVVGSFNPYRYNLDASYFRDANHPTAEAWTILFENFTFGDEDAL